MTKALEQLKTCLQDIAKKENYLLSKIDIRPISSGGANYTTYLYLATISEALKPDINIFAKAANLSEEARKSNEILTDVYKVEAMNSEVAVNFERIYNKYGVPQKDRLAIPKYYGHVLIPCEEILILENLEVKGFKSFDRMKTFNWDYASTAVTQLARFHALGLALREENPEEFQRLLGLFKFDFLQNQEMMNVFQKMAIENGSEGLNDDEKERLHKYFTQDNWMEIVKNMMGNETFLIHGDYKPNNLMHRRRNGKLEIVPLDYQTLKAGNPVVDLLHFVFIGSDAEFRRLHYQGLIDHYFSQLTLALQQLNVDVENVYPRQTFNEDLIKVRPLGLFLGLMMLGMVTVAPDEAPKIDGDWNKMRFKPSQLATDRITGIVRDFIRWGVL